MAESEFNKLIAEITKIYNNIFSQEIDYIFSEEEIKVWLFSSALNKNKREAVKKIDNKTTFVNFEHLDGLVRNFADLSEKQKCLLGLSRPKFTALGGKGSLNTFTVSEKQERMFCNEIVNYFKNNYENLFGDFCDTWNLSELEITDSYLQILFHYLTSMVAYVGLRHNNIESSYAVSDIELDRFITFLNKNKKIIFSGDFLCGKTTFLEHYARKNRNKVFYLDCNFTKINKVDIFSALRPDYIFWKKLRKKVGNSTDFIIPNIKNKEFDSDDFYKKYLSNISVDDVLIIDHIADLQFINELKGLPCKIVCVFNLSIDVTELEMPVFKYENTWVIRKILGDSCDDLCFKSLHSSIGANCLLYKIITKAHMAYGDEYNLIHKLSQAKTIDDYTEVLNKKNNNKSVTFSMNYSKHLKISSSEKSVFAHVVSLYKEHLGNVDSISMPQEDREKVTYHQQLRLLYRLVCEGIDFVEICEYLNFKDIQKILNKFNWIKCGKICIPPIVVVSFNAKKLNNNQIAENLNMCIDLIVPLFDVRFCRINTRVFTAILNCLLDELAYSTSKSAFKTDAAAKPFIKVLRDEYGVAFKEKVFNKKAMEITDSVEETILFKKLNLAHFFKNAILYAYNYGEFDLYNKIMKYYDKYCNQNESLYYIIWTHFINGGAIAIAKIFDTKDNSSMLHGICNDSLALTMVMECYNFHIRWLITEIIKNILNNSKETNSVILAELERFKERLLEIIQIYNRYHIEDVSDYSKIILDNYQTIVMICNNIKLAIEKREVKQIEFETLSNLVKSKPYIYAKENYLILLGLLVALNQPIENLDYTRKELILYFTDTKNVIGDLDIPLRKFVYLVETTI